MPRGGPHGHAEVLHSMGGFLVLWNRLWTWADPWLGRLGAVASIMTFGVGWAVGRRAGAEARATAEAQARQQATLAQARGAAFEMLEAQVTATRIAEAVRAGPQGLEVAARLATDLRAMGTSAVRRVPTPYPKDLAYRLVAVRGLCADLQKALVEATVLGLTAADQLEVLTLASDAVAATAHLARELRAWGEKENGQHGAPTPAKRA